MLILTGGFNDRYLIPFSAVNRFDLYRFCLKLFWY